MKKNEYTIESSFTEVSNVCAEIQKFCLDEGLKQADCNEVEICLIESLNNIIKHAYRQKPKNRINIVIKIEKNFVEIILSDRGIARKNIEKPKLEFNPKDLESVPENGMGLYIIDQLMDETSYSSSRGINTFRMKKYVA